MDLLKFSSTFIFHPIHTLSVKSLTTCRLNSWSLDMSRKTNICQVTLLRWNVGTLHFCLPSSPYYILFCDGNERTNTLNSSFLRTQIVSWLVVAKSRNIHLKFIRVSVRLRAQFINFLFIKYLTTWGYLLAILFLYFICILWTWSFLNLMFFVTISRQGWSLDYFLWQSVYFLLFRCNLTQHLKDAKQIAKTTNDYPESVMKSRHCHWIVSCSK